jgi:hypothetical protein
MGPSDNRYTQIDILALAGPRSPTKVTKRTVSYESLGSTPKTDASSKKRAGSREGASDASSGTEKAPLRTVTSATSGPLQLRAVWESLWEKYEKIYDHGSGKALRRLPTSL